MGYGFIIILYHLGDLDTVKKRDRIIIKDHITGISVLIFFMLPGANILIVKIAQKYLKIKNLLLTQDIDPVVFVSLERNLDGRL
jgi:hypothetical protein